MEELLSVESLWQQFGKAKSKKKRLELRNQLAEFYIPLVQRAAKRFCKRLPYEITYDDLFAAGFIGLLTSIPRFRPGTGATPGTFFCRRIWGAMGDYLRDQDHLSRTSRGRFTQVRKLHRQIGREPTDGEISTALRVPQDQARMYRRAPRNQSLYQENAGGFSLLCELRSRQDKSTEFREQIEDLLKSCTERERNILRLYYLERLNMGQVAELLGTSASRVSQLHTEAMEKLRSRHSPKRKWAC